MKMIKLFEAWSQVNEYSTKNRGKNFVVPPSQPQKPTGPLGRIQGGGLHNYETIIWQYPKPSAELLKQGATGTPITEVPPQFFGGNGFPTVAREAGDNVSTTPMTAWVMEPGGESLRLAGQGEYEDYMKDPSSLDADSPYNKNTNEYDNIKKNKTNTKKTTAPIGVTPNLLTKIQMRLRDLGGSYAAALGTGGPGKDGVDGKFGPSTAAAINLALDALGTAVPGMKKQEMPKTTPLNAIEPGILGDTKTEPAEDTSRFDV
jgi:hypothetical protein